MPANHVKRAYAPIGKLTPLNLFRISAFHSHKQEGLETNFPSFPGVPFRRRKLSGNNFFPSAIPPYGLPENIHFRQES
ncbi:hypothetical protein EAI25_01540 [Akkermansia muciniphila]|nr:hypothetical protein [Akkermansia muciniphila]